MKTQHTAGPWITRSYPNSRGEIVCAKVWAGNEFSGSYVCAISSSDVAYNMSMAEGCANARLIAAAPELLAALQELLLCSWPTEQDSRTDRAMHKAECAIAKATGQPEGVER